MMIEGEVINKIKNKSSNYLGLFIKLLIACFTCCILVAALWIIGLIYFANWVIENFPQIPMPSIELPQNRNDSLSV